MTVIEAVWEQVLKGKDGSENESNDDDQHQQQCRCTGIQKYYKRALLSTDNL